MNIRSYIPRCHTQLLAFTQVSMVTDGEKVKKTPCRITPTSDSECLSCCHCQGMLPCILLSENGLFSYVNEAFFLAMAILLTL